MLCGKHTVVKLESELESESEGLLFAAAVTPKKLAALPFSCSLYEPKMVGRSLSRRSNLVRHYSSFVAAIVYSFKKRTALHMFFSRSFTKACKVTVTLKGRPWTRLKDPLRLRVVFPSRLYCALLMRLTNTSSSLSFQTSK